MTIPASQHSYAYAHNNPANLTDPTGEAVALPPDHPFLQVEEGDEWMLLPSPVGTAVSYAAIGRAALANATRGAIARNSFNALKNALGSAGLGNVWHHIVEQRLAGRVFPPQLIHCTQNVAAVSRQINQKIANYYAAKRPFTQGLTVRKWLEQQPYRDQYEFGVEVLGRILSGAPLP